VPVGINAAVQACLHCAAKPSHAGHGWCHKRLGEHEGQNEMGVVALVTGPIV
jgi:hypothetical protein